jgi:hypothetical protein
VARFAQQTGVCIISTKCNKAAAFASIYDKRVSRSAGHRSWSKSELCELVSSCGAYGYEVVSKVFRTSATICAVVGVARSTGPNRPNCEFRVLLRLFTATAWKRAKTSPRTLTRTDLDASFQVCWHLPLGLIPLCSSSPGHFVVSLCLDIITSFYF